MKLKVQWWGALVLAVLLLGACGDSGAAQPAKGSEAESATAAARAPAEMTPAELGEAIGAVYVRALGTVADLVVDRPEPDAVRPKLAQLKDECVTRLVEMGRAREAMGAADRATVDGKVRMAVSGVPTDVFTAYAEGQNHYLGTDADLADLIASFNVITQYASFDLLKKQAPAEAERLGIQ